jgi:hypothetical protein
MDFQQHEFAMKLTNSMAAAQAGLMECECDVHM